MRASKKTFFLRNFRRIFGEFSANFRRIFRISGEFSEFPENFWIFRRIFGGKRQNKGISRYSIWEVRYDILFDIRKSPIYRHSINSRYDKLLPDRDYLEKGIGPKDPLIDVLQCPSLIIGGAMETSFDDSLRQVADQLCDPKKMIFIPAPLLPLLGLEQIFPSSELEGCAGGGPNVHLGPVVLHPKKCLRGAVLSCSY